MKRSKPGLTDRVHHHILKMRKFGCKTLLFLTAATYLRKLVNQFITVKMAGQSLTLKCDNNEQQLIEIAKCVDETFLQVQSVSLRATPYQVLLLTALNLAEEVLKNQKETARLKSEVETNCEKILTIIEAEVLPEFKGSPTNEELIFAEHTSQKGSKKSSKV